MEAAPSSTNSPRPSKRGRLTPSPSEHLRILRSSQHVVLALDADQQQVIGFINALGDGVVSAFIPLLEVLPEHRGRGIGSELVRRMLHELRHYRCIDLTCDGELRGFYTRLGMQPAGAMIVRQRPHRL